VPRRGSTQPPRLPRIFTARFGRRVVAAGFGGNTVNLVEAARASDVAADLVERYAARIGRRTTATVVRPSAGVEVTRL
jgi:galactokinase